MIVIVYRMHALTKHGSTRPAVPLVIHPVGEFVGQFLADIGNQRRHLIGDQAHPAFALTQGFGVAVTLGDVGVGIDEAAGRHRMGPHLQHAAIGQPLRQLQYWPLPVMAARRQQRYLAARHHITEQAVYLLRGQAGEFQKTSVPQLQLAGTVDHGHALREVIHGALQ